MKERRIDEKYEIDASWAYLNIEKAFARRGKCAAMVCVDEGRAKYLNAYLYSKFGVYLDKPEYVDERFVQAIAEEFGEEAPESFLENPQHSAWYTEDELALEQLASYFFRYGQKDSHVVLFDKDLPKYPLGREIKPRKYVVYQGNDFMDEAYSIEKDLYVSKRPWSKQEFDEALALTTLCAFPNDYEKIACGLNAARMSIAFSPIYAKAAWQKDFILLSQHERQYVKDGEKRRISFDIDKGRLKRALPLAKKHPLSKKQAKLFSKLCRFAGVDIEIERSEANRRMFKAVKEGDASLIESPGTLLRSARAIYAKTDGKELEEKLLQAAEGLDPVSIRQAEYYEEGKRIFSHYSRGLKSVHVETDDEMRKRQSALTLEKLKGYRAMLDKAFSLSCKKHGELNGKKVYLSDAFRKIAAPVNTSASGSGVDAIPAGSKLDMSKSKIRLFSRWEDIRDIDLALVLTYDTHAPEVCSFWNLSAFNKKYRGALRFSGDDTSCAGAEYFDLDMGSLKKQGASGALVVVKAYGGKLSSGSVFWGWQEKDDFSTVAWDPKNVAFESRVGGSERTAICAYLDFGSMEAVVINEAFSDEDRCADAEGLLKAAKRYLSPEYLLDNGVESFVLASRAEIVDSPEEADVVFMDGYEPKPDQEAASSFDKQKLARLLYL